MKTPDLINALVADGRHEPPPGATLARLLLPACLASCAALLATAGLRPDIALAATTPRVLFKWMLAVALVCFAAGASLRVARPGASLQGWRVALLATAAMLVAGIAVELVLLPREQWAAQARGENATWCLRMIPLLAAAPLAAILIALHRAAPTRPALAGAIAGLLAGAAGAALYSLHCTDDSPLFVANWYGLAIAIVVGIGALLGKRVLRW